MNDLIRGFLDGFLRAMMWFVALVLFLLAVLVMLACLTSCRSIQPIQIIRSHSVTIIQYDGGGSIDKPISARATFPLIP